MTNINIVRVLNQVFITLNGGITLGSSVCTDEMFAKLQEARLADDEEAIKQIIDPAYSIRKDANDKAIEKLAILQNSNIIEKVGESSYLKGVPTSLPQTLLDKFLEAEIAEDAKTITALTNFWILASRNPNTEARNNLYWFMDRYGIKVTESGFIIAYRLVIPFSEEETIDESMIEAYNKLRLHILKVKKQSLSKYDLVKNTSTGEITTIQKNKLNKEGFEIIQCMSKPLEIKGVRQIFTDAYSGTIKISIGETVSIPREECDENSAVTCSRGLHGASFSWLKDNSNFGEVKIVILVNPRDITAVPPKDSYGKLRMCSYYPLAVMSEDVEIGDELNLMEDDFLQQLIKQEEFTLDKKAHVTKDYVVDTNLTFGGRDLHKTSVIHDLESIRAQIASRKQTTEDNG